MGKGVFEQKLIQVGVPAVKFRRRNGQPFDLAVLLAAT
jgi:hypothetical protein